MTTIIAIPQEFLNIQYNPKQTPESQLSIFKHGANCQLFAYSLLKHFGYSIPPLRSSDLWEDQEFTKNVDELKPFDLMLYHSKPEAWGAHVGLYIGNDTVLHLSQGIGTPEKRHHNDFKLSEKYKCFIGAKRLKKPLIKSNYFHSNRPKSGVI